MRDGVCCSQERYKGLAIGLANLMTDKRFHLSASVYTEVSDVEAEINGWVTYDRKVGTYNNHSTKLFSEGACLELTAWLQNAVGKR